MDLTPSSMLSMAAIVIVSLAIAWQSISLLCLRFAQRTDNSAIYHVLAVCAPTRIRRIAASTIALSTLGISTSVADDTYTQTLGGETMNQTRIRCAHQPGSPLRSRLIRPRTQHASRQ